MRRFVVLLLLLPLTLSLAAAQSKPRKVEGIDARTVAAYEKLGAVYGGVVQGRSGFHEFEEGKEAARKGLAGFRFKSLADGKLPSLPQVNVPFALDLDFTEVTDAGLKELGSLKSLSFLDLMGTKVTDAGLKHLTGLKNLASLDLRETKVTESG
jgi:hypothetical protein